MRILFRVTKRQTKRMVVARVIYTFLAVVSIFSSTVLSSGQCRKRVNYDGLNVYPIKVSKNEKLLGAVRGKKAIWGHCSMYDLKKAVSIEYLTQTDEYAAHFTCPDPKNKFCDRESNDCFHGECNIELGEKEFCVSLGTSETSDELHFNFVEGTCAPEFKPLDPMQMEVKLVQAKLDVDSILKRATDKMAYLYDVSRKCQDGRMSTSPNADSDSS